MMDPIFLTLNAFKNQENQAGVVCCHGKPDHERVMTTLCCSCKYHVCCMSLIEKYSECCAEDLKCQLMAEKHPIKFEPDEEMLKELRPHTRPSDYPLIGNPWKT